LSQRNLNLSFQFITANTSHHLTNYHESASLQLGFQSKRSSKHPTLQGRASIENRRQNAIGWDQSRECQQNGYEWDSNASNSCPRQSETYPGIKFEAILERRMVLNHSAIRSGSGPPRNPSRD